MSLQEPDTADCSHPWYQPLGFRVWNIWASHQGRTLAEYNTEQKNNHIKLLHFKNLLAKKGYKLSASQLSTIKSKLSINFVVSEQSESDLRRMCGHCGVETDIKKVCRYSHTELVNFGNNLGLDFDELEDVLVKYGDGSYTRTR
jgi:hypothetical protein